MVQCRLKKAFFCSLGVGGKLASEQTPENGRLRPAGKGVLHHGVTGKFSYNSSAPLGSGEPLFNLCALDHRVALAPRCERRAQTGPSPDPLCHVGDGTRADREVPEKRRRRRRGPRQVPPPRRPGGLRCHGQDGAGLLAPLSPGRRLGKLRQPRRRSGGGHALHGSPPFKDRRRTAVRNRQGHGRLQAEL